MGSPSPEEPARLVSQLHSAQFLAQVSAALAESLDYDSIPERLAKLVVPSFADWCMVSLVEPDGASKRLAMINRDANLARRGDEILSRHRFDANRPHGLSEVMRTGRPELIRSLDQGTPGSPGRWEFRVA